MKKVLFKRALPIILLLCLIVSTMAGMFSASANPDDAAYHDVIVDTGSYGENYGNSGFGKTFAGKSYTDDFKLSFDFSVSGNDQRTDAWAKMTIDNFTLQVNRPALNDTISLKYNGTEIATASGTAVTTKSTYMLMNENGTVKVFRNGIQIISVVAEGYAPTYVGNVVLSGMGDYRVATVSAITLRAAGTEVDPGEVYIYPGQDVYLEWVNPEDTSIGLKVPDGVTVYDTDRVYMPANKTVEYLSAFGEVNRISYDFGWVNPYANGNLIGTVAAGSRTLRLHSIITAEAQTVEGSTWDTWATMLIFSVAAAPLEDPNQSNPDQAAANVVIAQIAALNTVVTLSDEAAIVAARSAYTALTPAQQALVTNLTKLTDAEAALNTLKSNQTAANAVISQIAALNTVVTLSDEVAIVAARSAYTALTPAQQALVTNLTKLTDAEAALNTLKSDKAAADIVISQIAALNTVVTLDDESAIVAARGAYGALTETQQALVTNLTKLTDAEAALNTLKSNKAAADAVISQIAALNTAVTLGDETAIVAARGAYTALTPAQQALVTNLTKLTDAEAALDLIKNPPIAQDKTELGIAIGQAQAILADGKTYSASSLSYLNVKLALAQKKFDSDKALQTSADVALAGLNSAIAAMADITDYNQTKSAAEEIIANIGNYTTASAAYLQRKCDLAFAMVDGTPNAKQARIDSAVAIINNALGQMVDQRAYRAAKAQAEALLADSATYTDSTISYLQRKYDLAFAMVDGTYGAKADRVARADAILINAFEALRTK